MPLISVDLWPGRTVDIKKKLVSDLTEALCRNVGCPREAVTIVLKEVPKENWGLGGQLASERFKD